MQIVVKTLKLMKEAELRKVMHLGREACRPTMVFPFKPEIHINPAEIKETR